MINCLNFCTLWEGACTDLFSISDYVCIYYFDSSKKHSDNAPISSYDEIQGVSPLPSYRFYTPAHDHGVHDFFKVFHPEAVHSADSSEDKDMLKTYYSNFVPCPILREDFPHVVLPLSSLFWT